MAHDERNQGDGRRGRGPQRLGDRGRRPDDDPDYGQERYGGAMTGDGFGQDYGGGSDPASFDLAPGYDASFAGPRFDRVDVGSVGSHGVHPVSSVYGGDLSGPMGVHPGGGFSSSARRYAELGRLGGRHDPHYAEWRTRQIAQLDRDYDDYRREHQARFDKEFGEWRERRGQQRQAVGRVSGHMEVVGSDGSHVGTVDCTSGDRIVLAKSDPNAHGHHHFIPCGWVETVDDKVRLNLTADEAMQRWRHEERSGALFERGERDDDRPRGGGDRDAAMRGRDEGFRRG